MKSSPMKKIHHRFFSMFSKIVVTVIILISPCRAGQHGNPEIPSINEDSTREVMTRAKEMTAVERRKTEEEKVYVSSFSITPHRQNYFLLVNYDSYPNTERYASADEGEPKKYEAKFQLSFKIRIWETMFGNNGDLFFAYTQRSFWQLYDKALSSPFRETNYEPEIFMKFDTDLDITGLRNRFFLIGFNHQSNGRGEPLSRSWNRIYAELVAERGNFAIAVKPWYRIPEEENDDDNPDIEKYIGYGELIAAYHRKEYVFSVLLRNNLRINKNRGAIELGWSFPISHKVRGYVQYFNGYGESLVDYDDAATKIGFGVMMNDWI